MTDKLGMVFAGSAEAGGTPGAFTRNYLELRETLSERERQLVNGGLLAGFTHDPGLLEPLRESYRMVQTELESDGLNPALATLLRLASDGLWLTRLFDFAPLSADLQDDVRSLAYKLSHVSDERLEHMLGDAEQS